MLNSFSPFYVERPPIESLCYEAISQPGGLIVINGPSQMGKTELMAKILHYAQQQGYQKVYLSLHQLEDARFRDLDCFLQWLCTKVSSELKLQQPLQFGDNWDDDLSANDNCSVYFEQFILPQLQGSFILVLDDLDCLISHPVLGLNFFCMLRAWSEDARFSDSWEKIRFVFASSRKLSFRNDLTSWSFNVGLYIDLPPFTPFQVAELVRKSGYSLSEVELSDLIERVGGVPGLILQALKLL